ncbi:MAG: hypothetical protein NTW13_02795 [Candidatus Omnitrophica bacterium]|nr:hypothetical protein [Candidatus Omnitrophota bacterium]
MVKFKVKILSLTILFLSLVIFPLSFAQNTDDLELVLDVNSNTVVLPKIFNPNLDLSGRGFSQDKDWPQELAGKEVLETWQKDIGFKGLYRIQYDLWEIDQLNKDQEAKQKLLANYEKVIKDINDAGGTVILDIFGTPAGLGKVLDKKSAPINLKVFKELVKETMRDLSCNKKYRIWYEAWSAPDLDDFFLGRKQEYLNLYRAIAESARELKEEYKVDIPVGGPSTSWWFHNPDTNTALSPEKSLIYELIKFCRQAHLPLDFITWHAYSSDPKVEKESTIYNKAMVSLIRDWLIYFNFNKNTLLIIDEWNYDRDANVLLERGEKSFVAASYIPARLKNMYEAGIDNQVYFALEDFQNNKEGVTRNVGVFYFERANFQDKAGAKAIFNVFRMLNKLGPDMFLVKLSDEFVGAIASKSQDEFSILIYNYLDPDIVKNYFSQDIAGLNEAERRFLLNLIRSGQLNKIILGQEEIDSLRVTNNTKSLLKKAKELSDKLKQFQASNRNIKITLQNIKEEYLYSRFSLNSSCGISCEFKPVEEKEVIPAQNSFQESLTLSPYSVNLIILKKKPVVVPALENVVVPKNTEADATKK